MIQTRFGYLQEATILTWGAGQIDPLVDHASIVEHMQSNDRAYGGWLYPPLGPVARDSKESKDAPLIAKGFSLPSTHMLSLSDEGWTDECANFFIALFGMLMGRRLQREGWQHFCKAPIDSKLCDFCADNREIVLALNKATEFWVKNVDSETRKLAFGALHWHLFAQLYEHDFERFNAQYMALDACSELAIAISWPGYPQRRPPHAKRASELCMSTGVSMPEWAAISAGKETCALADRRNALIHEGMYGGQPAGFAHPEKFRSMEFELTGLVARILLRLLDIDNEYTRSDCTTRQTIGFSFDAIH